MSTPQFAFNVPVRGIDEETRNKPVCEVTTPQDHQADFGKTLAKLINGNHVETLPGMVENDTPSREIQLNPTTTTQPQDQEKTNTEAALRETLIESQSTPLERQLRSKLPVLETPKKTSEAGALEANIQNTTVYADNTLATLKTPEPSGLHINQLSTEEMTAPHTMLTASNDPTDSKRLAGTTPVKLGGISDDGVSLRVALKGNSALETDGEQPKSFKNLEADTNNLPPSLTDTPAAGTSDVIESELSSLEPAATPSVPTKGIEIATRELASPKSVLESSANLVKPQVFAVPNNSTLAPIVRTLEAEAADSKFIVKNTTGSVQGTTSLLTTSSGNLSSTTSKSPQPMDPKSAPPATASSEFDAIDTPAIGSTSNPTAAVSSQNLPPPNSTVQAPPMVPQIEGDLATSLSASPSNIAASSTIHPASPNAPTPLPNHISMQICQALESGGSQDVEIRLDPEELGRIRIVLSTKEGGMNIAVFTERPEVLDMMRRNSDLLASDFSDIGYEGANFSFQKEQHERNQSTTSTQENRDTGVTADAPESHQPQAIDGSARLDLKF
ncbi:flagellar hook-length control protein FliK [Litoreibacter ascidiaceicola]|nr:flagellar hook-length control protein FliK [Litoreibacter ascidiaceicola]